MGLNMRVLPRIFTQEQVEALTDMDRTNFGCEPSEVALEWVKRFPWMYTLVERETPKGWKTFGYGLVIPVKGGIIEGLRSGEVGEEEITPNKITRPVDADGFYIASFGTNSEITTYESRMLVGSVIGPYLRERRPVVAVAITPSGKRVAREGGLVPRAAYNNPKFKGVNGYEPIFLEKEPFEF